MKKILLCVTVALTAMSSNAQNNCSDIFISEYVEGSENNKAIELYNPTSQPILLDGRYSMGRDRNGAGVPMLMDITGTIQPYDVLVFALDKRNPDGTAEELPLWPELIAAADTFLNPVYDWNGPNSGQSYSPMYFNGDDAFVLVKNDFTILDIIGRIGEDPGGGWWVPGDPNTAWWTEDNTLIRKSNVQRGLFENPAVFDPSLEWDSLPRNTFTNLGTHNCVCGSIPVEERDKHQFSIFPNPILEGHFAVKASHQISSYTLRAADSRILSTSDIINSSHINISLPQAQAGVYYIEIIYTDGSRTTRKLISR
jgi:hypothetical protein